MPTRISYDGMSRLTAAGYLENGKRNDHFSTSYKYDLMGNILSLRREGLLNSGNYGTIDDLTYSYKGNQVVKIDDAAEESPSYRGAMHFRDYADEKTEYTYDANGNMLTDSNKGITSIDYNVLDLPQCISTKSRALFKENFNDTIYYTYSADGTKLCSTYKEAKSRILSYNPKASLTSLNVGTVGIAKPIVKRLKTEYYYCSNLVYDNDNISAILFDGGYASVDDDNGIVMHFYVKDHLGSNRLVVDGNGNIEEVNHYYPFGALMGDRCGVSQNNYKYIGKELDTMYGWNMQDHKARWYDPVVGRWIVTDPLQGKYASFSTYCYALNNPPLLKDYDGEEPISAIIEGVTAFGITAGVEFVNNWIIEGNDFHTAFKRISWGAAALDGLATCGVSLFVSGAGTARKIAELANTKAGRFTVDFIQAMITNVVAKFEKKEYKSFRDINFRNELKEAIFVTVLNHNMPKRADDLLESLKQHNISLHNKLAKLERNLQANKNEVRIKRDKYKVNGAITESKKAAAAYMKKRTKFGFVSGLSANGINKIMKEDENENEEGK